MRTIHAWSLCAAIVAAAAGGCAAELEPAPGAELVAEDAAIEREAGVEIVAAADAWRGYPDDLDAMLTPVLVTITNNSEADLQIRYEYFTLDYPAGGHFAALPPFQISGTTAERVATTGPVMPYGPVVGFGVAPYLSPWYPGWSVYGGPFPYSTGYYGTYYDSFSRIVLPTGDMIQKALPEGVLAPGGRVSGFIYFEEVEGARRVDFVAHLVNAGTGKEFGELRIPFLVR